MKGLKFMLAAVMICCSAWFISCNIEQVNDTPKATGAFANIPVAGNAIRCDDGSSYMIRDTVCVEAWDMFKNGVYYKTLYEIGVQHGEVGHE